MKQKRPTSLWAPHGPIKVEYRDELFNSQGDRLNGCYIEDDRTILVSSQLDGFILDEIIEHEWLHAVMQDSAGAEAIGEREEEWVCRVVGRCLASRRRGE